MSTTSRQNAAKLRREKERARRATEKTVIPISEEGMAALKSEYEELTKVKRKQIAGVVQQAREEGDLRENAGYHAAREEQGMIEARIRELEYLMQNSVVTKDAVTDADAIRVGSTVTLDLDGDEMTYTIVGAVEAQPRLGRISNESPVGRGLLGHRAGDDFTIDTPAASLRVHIKSVRNE
jgi:transcription elongation factor GreA